MSNDQDGQRVSGQPQPQGLIWMAVFAVLIIITFSIPACIKAFAP